MTFKRISVTENDLRRIRDFLVESYRDNCGQKNWFIDRWNFCRYFVQSMYRTYDTWLNSVGLWIDENNNILAIANSEGENKGEAFLQLGNTHFSEEMLHEILDFAEIHLSSENDSGRFINLRVNEDAEHVKAILMQRGYVLQDWKESTSVLLIDQYYDVYIPTGFRILDSTVVSNHQKGLAHGRAFGRYKEDRPDDDILEKAYQSMRTAPDYRPDLDISLIDNNDEVAAFATVWFDDMNKIGILEPVGTIPKYRGLGLGKAVIFEGINRIRNLGAKKMYVGSDQQFYRSIGFSLAYAKEIWQKIVPE